MVEGDARGAGAGPAGPAQRGGGLDDEEFGEDADFDDEDMEDDEDDEDEEL